MLGPFPLCWHNLFLVILTRRRKCLYLLRAQLADAGAHQVAGLLRRDGPHNEVAGKPGAMESFKGIMGSSMALYEGWEKVEHLVNRGLDQK